MKQKDHICPTGKWQFNQQVTDCFADMLERSVPDYRAMRSLVFEIGRQFVKPQTAIVDMGCSTGLAAQPFIETYGGGNHFILIDSAESMAEACRKRYADSAAYVDVFCGDLRNFLPLAEKAGLIMAVLSLQFLPTVCRQRVVNDICNSLQSGGAFILVEKVAGGSCDKLLGELFFDMKRRNGYSDEQIISKNQSLENVLSPLKAEWNEDLLKAAGFRRVEMFWRCLNFCGWLAVK